MERPEALSRKEKKKKKKQKRAVDDTEDDTEVQQIEHLWRSTIKALLVPQSL